MGRLFIAPQQTYLDPNTGEESRGPIPLADWGLYSWSADEIVDGWFLVGSPDLNSSPNIPNSYDLGGNVNATIDSIGLSRPAQNQLSSILGIERSLLLTMTIAEVWVEVFTRDAALRGKALLPNGRTGRWKIDLGGFTLMDLPVLTGGADIWTDTLAYSAGRLQTVGTDWADTSNFWQVVTGPLIQWSQNNQQGYAVKTVDLLSSNHGIRYNGGFLTNASYSAHGSVLRQNTTPGDDGYRAILGVEMGPIIYAYYSVITGGSKTDLSSVNLGYTSGWIADRDWSFEVDGNTITIALDGTPVSTYGSATAHTDNTRSGLYAGKYGGGNIRFLPNVVGYNFTTPPTGPVRKVKTGGTFVTAVRKVKTGGTFVTATRTAL